MKNLSHILLLFCFLFPAFLLSQSLSQTIDTYLESYARIQDFSGCVLVVKEGKELHRSCLGNAVEEFQVSNSPSTKFKIGSISKQFTAAAILKLEAQGLLSTEDPVLNFFSGANLTNEMTVHHLLTHTSGVADIFRLPGFLSMSKSEIPLDSLARLLLQQEPDFLPGEQYAYSNGGYTLLATIIEQLSGMSYGDFLTKEILEPIGLNQTGDWFAASVVPHLAMGYDPKGGEGKAHTDYIHDVYLRGSGSLYSTVDDLARWIEELKTGEMLGKELCSKLLTNHVRGYGYGISVYKSFEQPVFGHDGRINGFIADYLHYRDSDLSIILLGNIQTGVADFLRRDLAAILFGKSFASKARDIPVAPAYPAALDLLTGGYEFSPNFWVYVEEKDATLLARANQGSFSELIPLKNGQWFSRVLYARVEFGENEQGEKILKWINNDGNIFVGIMRWTTWFWKEIRIFVRKSAFLSQEICYLCRRNR